VFGAVNGNVATEPSNDVPGGAADGDASDLPSHFLGQSPTGRAGFAHVGSPLHRRLRFAKNWQSLASIVAGVALWQIVVSLFHPNPLAVVGPWEVARDARTLASTGVLWTDMRVSLEQFGIGFTIALVSGIAVGVGLGSSRRVSRIFNPWVTVLYTVPVIAMAPLIIVSLGIGMKAKVVIVAVSAFFPIVINTRTGVQGVDRSLHDVSTAFRATRWEKFHSVILPGSVPYILSGVRLGVGRGLIGLVFGDLFGATAGLGYLMLSAQQNLQTGNVYVAVVVLGLLGLLFGGAVQLLERRFATYRADG
jgi:ABC-type nitrate/sulfonate/bicarbonate transport system permease component